MINCFSVFPEGMSSQSPCNKEIEVKLKFAFNTGLMTFIQISESVKMICTNLTGMEMKPKGKCVTSKNNGELNRNCKLINQTDLIPSSQNLIHIRFYHQLNKLGEFCFCFPTQNFFCFGRISN